MDDSHTGPFLLHESGMEAGALVPVTLPVSIGRHPSCSLFLTDPSVSRKHAQIDPTPDGPLIKDLDSGNGTFVNGEQIFQAVTLKDRDRIRFGESEFTFMEKPAE